MHPQHWLPIRTFCELGKTSVVRDYFDVFDEVLFAKEHTLNCTKCADRSYETLPSHYIHIGGDRCAKKRGRSVPIASI